MIDFTQYSIFCNLLERSLTVSHDILFLLEQKAKAPRNPILEKVRRRPQWSLVVFPVGEQKMDRMWKGGLFLHALSEILVQFPGKWPKINFLQVSAILKSRHRGHSDGLGSHTHWVGEILKINLDIFHFDWCWIQPHEVLKAEAGRWDRCCPRLWHTVWIRVQG